MANNLMKSLNPLLQNIAQQEQKHQNLEQFASDINSLDDLLQMRRASKNLELKHDLDERIEDILNNANERNIDIVQTMQKFFKRRDDNVIYDYIENVKKKALRQPVQNR